MNLEENKYYIFMKKHHKVISIVEGIFIIWLLSTLWAMQFRSIELQKEISLNCGWEEEDFECYCEKSEALALKNRMMNEEVVINIDNETDKSSLKFMELVGMDTPEKFNSTEYFKGE